MLQIVQSSRVIKVGEEYSQKDNYYENEEIGKAWTGILFFSPSNTHTLPLFLNLPRTFFKLLNQFESSMAVNTG